jgi:hypothetical protein
VESDLPITDSAFHPKFKLFEVEGPGKKQMHDIANSIPMR